MLERIWSKENTPLLLVAVQTCATTMKINMVVSQKIRNQSTSGPSNTTTLGHIPKECSIILQGHLKDICTTMFIAALFVIARTWKQHRCPSTKEWIKKMSYIYTMAYYSVVKKQWHLEICMKMDVTRKSHPEWITKTQKNKHGMYSLISGYKL